MMPTVTQQLQSMKLRMEETIMPELPLQAKFAREQAAFIIMTLTWLLDTHEHQYRYEVVENAEYRKLIADMTDRDVGLPESDPLTAAARAALVAPGPSAEEAIIPLRDLIQQNRELKQRAMDLYKSLSERNGAQANPVRDLLARVALSQGKRELAFFERTGFTESPADLGTILGRQ